MMNFPMVDKTVQGEEEIVGATELYGDQAGVKIIKERNRWVEISDTWTLELESSHAVWWKH